MSLPCLLVKGTVSNQATLAVQSISWRQGGCCIQPWRALEKRTWSLEKDETERIGPCGTNKIHLAMLEEYHVTSSHVTSHKAYNSFIGLEYPSHAVRWQYAICQICSSYVTNVHCRVMNEYTIEQYYEIKGDKEDFAICCNVSRCFKLKRYIYTCTLYMKFVYF